MENNLSERDINIWDMFWAICLKWRQICLTALIVAILAGGVSYFRSANSLQGLQRIEQMNIDETDQINVDLYLKYMDLYNNQLLYNQQAPLMQLDANGFYLTTLNYYIDNHYVVEYPLINRTNNVDAIARSYQTLLISPKFSDKVKVEMDIEDERLLPFVLEQVDCNNRYGARTLANNTTNNVVTNTMGLMKISVYAKDEKESNTLAELVKDIIEQNKSDISNKFGEHEVILTEETCIYVSDNELLSFQRNNVDKLYNYSKNLSEIKKLMSDEAKSYVEQVESEKSNAESASNSVNTSIVGTVSKKLVVLGFVAGAFLAFAIIAFAYMLNKRLLFEDDFEHLYGIRLFGRLEEQREHKFFGFIDSWLLNLRRSNLHHFENNEVVEMMYVGIKLVAQKEESKKIYITGAGLSQCDNPLLEQVISKLKKDGIQVEIGKSILYYADALERLCKIGTVVFLEKAGESMYQEIQKEVEICTQQGICLLGAILME